MEEKWNMLIIVINTFVTLVFWQICGRYFICMLNVNLTYLLHRTRIVKDYINIDRSKLHKHTNVETISGD